MVLGRKHGVLKSVGLILVLLCCSVCRVHASSEKSPYEVLGVARESPQKDIQKSYKTLCLKYHPDKNVNKAKKERDRCEVQFKTIQHAYSLIGDESSRRSYNFLGRHHSSKAGGYGYSSTSSTNNPSSSSPYGSDPVAEAFFRAFQNSGPSFYFGRGNDGRPRFKVRRPFSSANPTENMMPTSLSFKSIYRQKVKISLDSLYTGVEDYQFELVDNLWTRWRAAIRGKIIYLSLYQGLIYSLPMLRTSRILAVIVGMIIVHTTLPKPDQFRLYTSSLRRGSKGGVTVKFTSTKFGQPEIVFEIVEASHLRYERVDNDLYTFIKITSEEAKRGCTKTIPPLNSTHGLITVIVPPESHRDCVIRIKGKGWPRQNAPDINLSGDLIVKVRIKKKGEKGKVLVSEDIS